MVRKIEGEGKKGYFFDENLALLSFLKNDSGNTDNSLVVFFSNGSFDGVIENFSKYTNEK
jgi:UDP-N-acetylmuramate-alanine ligase